jgi:hypothetical protein
MKRQLARITQRSFAEAKPQSREEFVKFFSEVKEEQQKYKDNSIFEYKRQWNRYTEMIRTERFIKDHFGVDRLNRAELGRAQLIVNAFSSFTVDEFIYFNHALIKAMKGLKVSETEEPVLDEAIKGFVSKLIRRV